MKRRVSWMLAVAAVVSLAAPAAGGAASRTFKPLQFAWVGLQLGGGVPGYWQTPVSVGSHADGNAERFYAPLKLPVGATITGLRYWHSAGAGGRTEVVVAYADETHGYTGEVRIIGGLSTAVTPPFAPVEVLGGAPEADTVVRKGRKYVVILSTNPDSFLWGATVTYQR